MAPDQQFERLNEWLEVIKKEVQQLRVDQHIFWQVQEMIQRNARINRLGSTFYQWMGSAYATSMAVAIRRQVDRDARSISLLNFLTELRAHPDALSRARYKRIFATANSALPEKYQDQDYDRLVGTGRDTVDPSDISDEIEQLEKATEGLRYYVNKRIAHRDECHLSNFPVVFPILCK